jgi:DNA replication protein DnaC
MKTLSDLIPEHQKTETRSCDDHGEYTSTNFLGAHWSGCPQCNEIEKLAREAAEKAEAEREAAERAARTWRIRVGSAAIPERFQDRTLDSYIATNPGQEKALAFSKDYAAQFDEIRKVGRCAIFVGKPGTGKTHLAVGIALHIMKDQRTVLFTTVQRAIRSIKDTWAKGSDTSESQAIAHLAAPDLLILDEVGVQFGSDFEKQILFDVLNERYEKRKPCILLSNIPPSELSGYLGERVADRLREDGGKLIAFDWESHRRKV